MSALEYLKHSANWLFARQTSGLNELSVFDVQVQQPHLQRLPRVLHRRLRQLPVTVEARAHLLLPQLVVAVGLPQLPVPVSLMQ